MTVVTVFSSAGVVMKNRHNRHDRHGKECGGMKNVQISYELFMALLRYHLIGDEDLADTVQQGLEQKLDAVVRHELYTKYKSAPTEEEREKSRLEYLDRRGISENFRW